MALHLHHADVFKKRPRAVIFDLDNTLYDYAHPHGEAMSAVREKVATSLNVSGGAFDNAFRSAREDIKKQLGPTASSHSRLLYFQRMIELLGLKSQPMLALDLEQTYWRTFLVNARLFPHAVDVLIELRAMGFPVALATDLTTQIQFRKLVYFNIDRYFDAIVTSEEAGSDKSSLKPFRLVMEKLQLPADALVWVIGDEESDVVTCREALPAARSFQKLPADGGRPLPGISASFEVFEEFWNALKTVPGA